jgi:hypothetical protein
LASTFGSGVGNNTSAELSILGSGSIGCASTGFGGSGTGCASTISGPGARSAWDSGPTGMGARSMITAGASRPPGGTTEANKR